MSENPSPQLAELETAAIRNLLDIPTLDVPIRSLSASDSPRREGTRIAHVRVLVESDAEMPPILVHRQTMQVIDGMHRLEAATIRGAQTISARFFDGDLEEAFVLGVELNVKHGLPLSLTDRKAAAARIIRSYPAWSDRAVAARTGLAHKTVGAIRKQSSGEVPQLKGRIGLDGRVRRVRTSTRRPRPDVRPGQAAETERQEAAGFLVRDDRNSAVSALARQSWEANLRRLGTDPSMKYTETGRAVLRILNVHVMTLSQWNRIAESVPDHLREALADVMLKCADDCRQFSVQLKQPTPRAR